MTDGVPVHTNLQWIHPIDAEAGEANMFSKDPKRIIYWISMAWTPYEKLSLPVSYEEAIAGLLTLKHLRNLIDQEIEHGITCYSDHVPGINNASLSNKGKLLINMDNVNAGKDAIVATPIAQRWRKPSNQINNTVGSVSDKIDFLISAQSDKLPKGS
jgi:hypothetical protein